MYNIFVGILQSVGDSRHPLIYLICSSCINVVLDIFLLQVLAKVLGRGPCDSYFPVYKCDLCMIHLYGQRRVPAAGW